MCRIFGCVGVDASARELAVASRRQLSGGPDGQYLRRGPGWALGANRLAIMDPTGGAQPYELGAVCVVFNGEIYNHRELRSALRARGHHFDDDCDGTILPAMYLEYGPSFLDHLDGMYSIALMDTRDEPLLLLATDHAGMKSLYYHWSPTTGRLYFSSELPGLFAFDDVPLHLTDSGLETFFALKHHPGPSTMFHGVSVLGPGRALQLRGGVLDHSRHSLPGLATGVDLQQLLPHEVGKVLTADVPACVVTSGGLDSSLVTALAAHGSTLHSFNVGYLGRWPGDERAYARDVSRHVGTTHHEVLIDPAGIPGLLQQTIPHLGQPNAAPICVSTYALFEAIHDAGFKVALTGDGADEIFGGYRHAIEATAAGDWWWPTYLQGLIATPAPLRHALYTEDHRHDVLSGVSVEERYLASPPNGPDVLGALLDFEVTTKFPTYHLQRVDHLSMAHSVEARLPFCQRRVVDVGRAMPQTQKIDGDRGKAPLYRLAARRVPQAVLERPKQPFTLPLAAMLHRVPELGDFAETVLTDPSVQRDGLLETRHVRELVHRCRERPFAVGAQAIWTLLVYQLWRDSVRRLDRARSTGDPM